MEFYLMHGACEEEMQKLAPACVDAVVTDPPRSQQDHAWVVEAHRVLKPGGLLLSFGVNASYHHLCAALEDAGFVLEDSLHWVYGLGQRHVPLVLCRKPGEKPEKSLTAQGSSPNLVLTHHPDCSLEVPTLPPVTGAWRLPYNATETSKIAAEMAEEGEAPHHRALVYDFLLFRGKSGATDAEIVKVTKLRHNTAPSRRCDLKKMGWVYDSGEVRLTETKRPAIVWRAILQDEVPAVWKCSKKCPVAAKEKRERKGKKEKKRAAASCQPQAVQWGADDFLPLFAASKKSRETRHPEGKPEALMDWMLPVVAASGDVVLDPFLGSGTTGVACLKAGISFVGIEIEGGFLEDARERLENVADSL